MVELVVEKLMVALLGGWNGGEREGEKQTVEKLQGIICVQDLSNLVAGRYIKFSCKVGNQTSFFQKK